MRFDRVLIIDHENREANEFLFKDGANLIVSTTNRQGKSSLVKTLYYALGLDIKIFPDNWHYKQMTIKLDITNEKTGDKLYVIRRGNLFYVPGKTKPLSMADYTTWLSDQLGVEMKLPIKLTKSISTISHPSALIVPFYIDQDESWSGRLFSSSSDMNMYSDTPQRVFEYVLGITDDDEAKIKEKKSLLNAQKKALSSKRKNINDVFSDYVNDLDPSVPVSSISMPEVANQQSIETFVALMDDASKIYIRHRATRIKMQRELDEKYKSLKEYKTILQMQKSDFNVIKCICKHCNSELTDEQVKTRMSIDTDMFELSYLISTVESEVIEIESQIADFKLLEEESKAEYEKLSKQVQSSKELKSIAEYIEESTKKKTQEEFATIITKLNSEIGSLDSDISELNRELRESYKESRAHVEAINVSFTEYVNDLSSMMAGSNVNKFEFKEFKAPASSGTHVNQAFLGIYLAYMRLTAKYGRYKLPYCIDSFLKNETADDNSEDMFEVTQKYLLGINGQSIFSIIQENVDQFISNPDQYHIINLDGKILSADKFQMGLDEIADKVVIE